MNRREMLRVLTSTAIVPLAARVWSDDWMSFGREVHAEVGRQATGFRGLDAAQSGVLTAACECIIPADETPGATAAGVPAFIDRVLVDWCDAAERDRFREGLQRIDTRCRADHSVGFAGASPAQQVSVLERFDVELTEWRRTATAAASPGVQALPQHAFGMLKVLTIWGYFTSEVGQRQELGLYPRPTTFDGSAPYRPKVQR